MFSTTISGALQGVEGILLQIEVDVSTGFPCLEMVGLLGSEVKEAKERVRVAIKNMGVSLPPKRICVNLSPANVRKAGTAYDLPIAIGILKSMELLPKACTNNMLLLGELGLDGKLKPVSGVFPILARAYKEHITTCIVAKENEEEARLFKQLKVYSFDTVSELVAFLKGELALPKESMHTPKIEKKKFEYTYEDIIGQQSGKRAALIGAAGGHNLLFIGPPGSGKTMLAKALPSILPPLSETERMEVAAIKSVLSTFSKEDFLNGTPTFVEVHHTATANTLIGGGKNPKAGAMTLAHKGVLFLDELPEFKRYVLDVMRQPLEEGKMTIVRSGNFYVFPTKVMLVAAMNPCPCGNYPDKNKCVCMPYQIRKYVGHISGPILDRIDVVAETLPLETNPKECVAGLSSDEMRQIVIKARQIQKDRYQTHFYKKNEKGDSYKSNGQLSSKEIEIICFLEEDAKQLLDMLCQKYSLSGRAYYSLLKVARTIADLEGNEAIGEGHLAEAAGYRLGCERYFYG